MKPSVQKAWPVVRRQSGTSWCPEWLTRVDNTGKGVSNLCRGLVCLGSRIASWLPSFSVEVMHTTNILGITQASNSQLNAMVRSTNRFTTVDDRRGADRVCSVSAALGRGSRIFRAIVSTHWDRLNSCVSKLETALETSFHFRCVADTLSFSEPCHAHSVVI